mmetsp:Transcript_23336/g.41711  ORF Transcript_23336/g.41711 Transcript_23336/m.41711 type:complete len:322 (+) Transcript_23336:133-1098(+)
MRGSRALVPSHEHLLAPPAPRNLNFGDDRLALGVYLRRPLVGPRLFVLHESLYNLRLIDLSGRLRVVFQLLQNQVKGRIHLLLALRRGERETRVDSLLLALDARLCLVAIHILDLSVGTVIQKRPGDPVVIILHGHVQRGLALFVLSVHVAVVLDEELENLLMTILCRYMHQTVAIVRVCELDRFRIELLLELRELGPSARRMDRFPRFRITAAAARARGDSGLGLRTCCTHAARQAGTSRAVHVDTFRSLRACGLLHSATVGTPVRKGGAVRNVRREARSIPSVVSHCEAYGNGIARGGKLNKSETWARDVEKIEQRNVP